ncbi:MAG: creatininase family protein [Defluviitaleaceae bacterium]|nr:creatininase family protein [Defluviitaleaceae bacterium]
MSEEKKGVFISDITVEDCESLLNDKSIVVLPIGGGAKEHGGHLPMGTDYFVTDWIAGEVTKRFPVITLPTLPYAYFPAFVTWKGSVSIQAFNFANFVEDILVSFVNHGVKKFLIIDGGVSTHIPLKILSATMTNKYGVKLGVTNCLGLGKEVDAKLCQQPRGGHGDESETSTLLHIKPELVKMENTLEEYFTELPGCTKNGINRVYLFQHANSGKGANGNSTFATARKGEQMLEAKVKDILDFLESFAMLEV